MAAASPEELETLLEDALLLHDDAAVAALFEDRGVLVAGAGCVRNRHRAAEVLLQRDYVASAHLFSPQGRHQLCDAAAGVAVDGIVFQIDAGGSPVALANGLGGPGRLRHR